MNRSSLRDEPPPNEILVKIVRPSVATQPTGVNDAIMAEYSTSGAAINSRDEDNDVALRDIEAQLNSDGELEFEDEEAAAARVAAERKRRREEILKKHQRELESSGSSKSTPDVGLPTSANGIDKSDSVADFSVHGNSKSSAPIFDQGTATKLLLVESEEQQAEALAAEEVAVAAEDRRNEPSAFDMFSSSPSDVELFKNGGANVLRAASAGALGADGGAHLQSNWDDGEGYYKLTIGEIIGARYRTLGVIGKGVFSSVLRCVDMSNNEDIVAIKLIRNNDIMRKAAEKELSILSLLAERDPDNKKHCVRLLNHLEYRNHVTFVFESMQMNLRETLKKFGKNVGINITAVRMYGRQLFVALKHMADLRIVHADLKPDNILVSNDLKQVKICDFGSAFFETDSDRDPTPYLVSRFYRAPEIILGLSYDHQVDLWSLAVCLYELFTGHVMFPGRSNNEMLRFMQAVKGRFPNKVLRTHLRSYESMGQEAHFDQDLKFKQHDTDPVTGKIVMKLVDIMQPTKDLAAILLSSKVCVFWGPH
jgi:serine/threonine-protein kinase PRP4